MQMLVYWTFFKMALDKCVTSGILGWKDCFEVAIHVKTAFILAGMLTAAGGKTNLARVGSNWPACTI